MSGVADQALFSLVHDFLKKYLPLQRRSSPNTISSYRIALEQLFEYVKKQHQVPIHGVSFSMLSADVIAGFLDFLEIERKCSIATRNQRLAAIRAFLKYAAAMDITTVSAYIETDRVPFKKPITLEPVGNMSEAAIKALLD